MKNELYFKLSKIYDGKEVEDHDLWQELVLAVPEVWGWKGWLSGQLSAPWRMLREGNASPDLWLRLGRTDVGYPFTVSPSDRTRDIKPDLAALFIHKRNPAVVVFENAGYLHTNNDVTFAAAQELAGHYCMRGYKGHLHFANASHRGDLSKSPLSCDLQFGVWEGNYPEAGTQQGRIRLVWNPSMGGKREDLAALESVCRNHGLEEYELIGAGDYYRKFEVQIPFDFMWDLPQHSSDKEKERMQRLPLAAE